MLGIPVDSKNDTYIAQMIKENYGIDVLEVNSKQGKNKESEIDEIAKEQLRKKKEEEEAIKQIERLHRFKLLFIIYDMVEFDKIPENQDGYTLVYSLMGDVKTRIKLSSKRTFRAGVPIIPVNKLRLHYFFSDERNDLIKYIQNGPLVVKLLHKNKLISKVSLDLKDFRSPDVNQKSYYTAMVGDDLS